MRKCVLDISKKRVGVAVSDEDSKFIIFSCCINYNNNFADLKRKLSAIYTKYKITETLIGLPVSENKDAQVNLIKHTAHNIRSIIKKFTFINENFSTLDAIMDKDKYVDMTIDEIVCRKLFVMYNEIICNV